MSKALLNRARMFSSAITFVSSTSWRSSKCSRMAANSSSVTLVGVRLIAFGVVEHELFQRVN